MAKRPSRVAQGPREKLVRDLIPAIAASQGETLHTRVARPDEMPKLLAQKLVEEAQEFLENPSLEELADVIEVVGGLTAMCGWTSDELRRMAMSKRFERGGFEAGVVMILESSGEVGKNT